MGRLLVDTLIPESMREAHRASPQRYLISGEARVLGKRLELTVVRLPGSESPVFVGFLHKVKSSRTVCH